MNPERWQQVEKVYHQARQRTPQERSCVSGRRVPRRLGSAPQSGVAAGWRGPGNGSLDRPTFTVAGPAPVPASVNPGGAHGRFLAGSVPDRGASWRRRNGAGVPRTRHAAVATRRHKGIDVRLGGSLHSGGSGGVRAQPSQHRHHLRRGRCRRHVLHRDGADRRPDLAAGDGGRAFAHSQAAGDCRADRRRSGRGARQGNHAPRPEARQHHDQRRGTGQDPGLRPGQIAARRPAACLPAR